MRVETNSYSQITIFLVLAILLILTILSCCSIWGGDVPAQTAKSAFVTRSGSQLMLNGHPFRFAGTNIHWLALDDATNYPSQFRVNDALDAAKEMGLTV